MIKPEYYVYPGFLELFSDPKALALSKHFHISWYLWIIFFLKQQVLYICFVLTEIFDNSEMEQWFSWVASLINEWIW